MSVVLHASRRIVIGVGGEYTLWSNASAATACSNVNTGTENLASLYRTIKTFSSEVRNDRRLAVPPADSATLYSAECGSQLTLDARIEDHQIREIGYKVRACSLGQATTAIVVRHAHGLDLETLCRVGGQLRDLLTGSGTSCDWPELEVFARAKDVPSRHGAALLPFLVAEQLFVRAADASATFHRSGRI